MNTASLLAIIFIPLLFAVGAKACGFTGVKKSRNEITVFVDWPTRIVISYFALLPIGFFCLDPARTWAASLLLAMLTAIPTLDAWITQIRLTEEGLYSRSPWRRSKFIPWDEIITVGKVSNGGGWAWSYINTRNKGKVRWNTLIDGQEHIESALDHFAPHATRTSTPLS